MTAYVAGSVFAAHDTGRRREEVLVHAQGRRRHLHRLQGEVEELSPEQSDNLKLIAFDLSIIAAMDICTMI
jgi:hypothetical protein